MSEVKWIKIKVDIFNDEKIQLIETMPDADTIIVIWFKLLALAGIKNDGGIVRMNDKMAYTDDMLATIFRRKVSVIILALETFRQFDMIDIVENAILINNWEKHQNVDGLDKIKLQNKERQQRYRNNQKTLLLEEKKEELDIKNKSKRETVTNTLRNVTKKNIVFADYGSKYIFNLKEISKLKLFDDIEVNDLFEMLLIQRTKLKKPAINSKMAITTIYNKLNKLGNSDCIFLLKDAIEGGWKTVYPKDTKEEIEEDDKYTKYINKF